MLDRTVQDWAKIDLRFLEVFLIYFKGHLGFFFHISMRELDVFGELMNIFSVLWRANTRELWLHTNIDDIIANGLK